MRYLAFVVVQAMIEARGKAGAIYATGAAGVRFRLSLLRSGVRSVSRAVSTEWILQSGQAVDGDDGDALDEAQS